MLLSSLGAHGTSAGDLSGWVAIGVSAGSLLVASVTGWFGVRFSRRALRLSERQEARQNLQPDLYLNTSRAWRTDSGRVLAALVRVSNPSERGTSIVAADLRLSYYADDTLVVIKVPHNQAAGIGLLPSDSDVCSLPRDIPGRSATVNWLCFSVQDALTGGRPVDRYELDLRDVSGSSLTLQVGLFTEVTT